VGVEIAVVVAQAAQVLAQQREVQGLFTGHLQPVAVEVLRHAEAPEGVQGQVDGVELDVADGVQQRGPALRREGRPGGHLVGRHQKGRSGRPGRPGVPVA
jgi:hypothetical protein